MELPIIVTCECFRELDANIVAGENSKDGTPRLHIGIKLCKHCFDEAIAEAVAAAIEEYRADQLAHSIDKAWDDRREH